MAYIGRTPDYGAFEKQTFTADGSTTTFSLNYTVGSSSSILILVSGVVQEPEVAYNIASGGTQVVFTAAPESAETVYVVFLGQVYDAAGLLSTYTITGQTELAAIPADDDYFLVYDTDATALKKVKKQYIAKLTVTRAYTGDGSTVGFTVTSGATVDSVLVSENGVLQRPTTDYTISSTTLTFAAAPSAAVQIIIRELPA